MYEETVSDVEPDDDNDEQNEDQDDDDAPNWEDETTKGKLDNRPSNSKRSRKEKVAGRPYFE